MKRDIAWMIAFCAVMLCGWFVLPDQFTQATMDTKPPTVHPSWAVKYIEFGFVKGGQSYPTCGIPPNWKPNVEYR